jgi:hypothetical protein
MTDGAPEIQRIGRERFTGRSGEERFITGAEVFDAARTMAEALPRLKI